MAKKRKKLAKKLGLPPGTLIFTGEQKLSQTLATAVKYNDDFFFKKKLNGDITTATPEPCSTDTVLWYNIMGVHNIATISHLGEVYGIHPLALEDVVNVSQRPKFDEYTTGLFIVIQDFSFQSDTSTLFSQQVALYVGENFIFSFQESDNDIFKEIVAQLEHSKGRIRKKKVDFLAYCLIDSIVDNYFHVADAIEVKIEELETEILSRPTQYSKEKVYHLKREIVPMRRSVMSLREAINKFIYSEHDIIDKNSLHIYLRDLHDHVIQIIDIVENQRDMLMGLNELYASELSTRMNNIMKLLTVISTIFIPLTFIVGVYGMNFENMPELKTRYGYFIVMGVMTFIFIASIWYFRKKKWI